MIEIKVRQISDGPFEINEKLAGLVPMAIIEEQVALTSDIELNGQRDAIVLWRGKVVDGRCRQLALVTLGRHIMYKELDDKLTGEEVKIFVKSVNTRRNLTQTQKIITACKQSFDSDCKKSIEELAKSWGIGREVLKNARYIYKNMPMIIDPLFNGKSVPINKNGKEIMTNKITTIYAYLKKIEEDTKIVESNGWKEDASIKTQEGKEWFYEKMISRNIPEDNFLARQDYIEFANIKFPRKIVRDAIFKDLTEI